MKLTLSWLKDHLETTASLTEIVETLTRIGLEHTHLLGTTLGAIAAENADSIIITDDNPRSENPASIRAAILKSANGAREIADRAEAIRNAVSSLQEGDVLLIAGKGHETGQIIGERTLPFSDHDAVAAALAPRVA